MMSDRFLQDVISTGVGGLQSVPNVVLELFRLEKVGEEDRC